MTNRKKWWVYEAASYVPTILIVALVDDEPLWQYFVIGLAAGIYGTLQVKQDRLPKEVS